MTLSLDPPNYLPEHSLHRMWLQLYKLNWPVWLVVSAQILRACVRDIQAFQGDESWNVGHQLYASHGDIALNNLDETAPQGRLSQIPLQYIRSWQSCT